MTRTTDQAALCPSPHCSLTCTPHTHTTLTNPSPSVRLAPQASKTTPAWRDYVDHVSEIVVDGFGAAIRASAAYLLAQMTTATTTTDAGGSGGGGGAACPLLEVELELAAPDVAWRPELGSSGGGGRPPGVRDLVTRWLAGFLEVGGLAKRLDTGEGGYGVELEEDPRVADALGRVMEAALAAEAPAEEFRRRFLRFEFLWRADPAAALAEFLAAHAQALPDGGRDDPPLSKFEEQIAKYR